MTGTGLMFTASDGAKLCYDDEGSGAPALLVHGYSANRKFWPFQRRALLDAGYRVITIDQRNHGDSEQVSFGQRMSRHGTDLRDLMDGLRLTDVTLIGHSMGVSASLALFSLHGTRDVSRFVAIDQSPKIINDEDWTWGVFGVEWPLAWAQANMRHPWGELGREPVVPEHVALEMAKVTPHHHSFPQDSFPHEQVTGLLMDHFVADWRDVLPRIDIPTWVVTGRHNPFYHPEGMEWFAQQVQRGSYSIFENSGHEPHMNEAELFNEQLLQFLRNTP
ncbi:alpha/beta fold hydrolase [Streptomyces sp. BH106]|uniref:alpha/beta fold hydrolase n=1 Tax=Streptomyces sp. BH106 TaxID=3410409 RepID=UPI003CEEB0E7